jgi:hypothetical protein
MGIGDIRTGYDPVHLPIPASGKAGKKCENSLKAVDMGADR